MAKATAARESDLYPPLRDYLVAQGYAVQGEVRRCDVVARKGDDLIVIELKRHFSTRLLIQAVDRQRITDSVYVALPGPFDRRRTSRWRGFERLLRRLELGLIVVTLGDPPHVQVIFHPLPYRQRKQNRRKRAVLKEISSRTGDYNEGGSTRRTVVTAYRENAIHIACCLQRLGTLAPRELRALGTGPKTTRILASNFYGWFRRVDRGIYELTPQGHRELEAYPEPVARYRALLDDRLAGAG